MRYTQGKFTPVFTSFGIVITILCFVHHNYCTIFFEHHRTVQEMARSVSVRRYSTVVHSIVNIDEESLGEIQVDKAASNGVASDITLSNFHENPTEPDVRSEKGETEYAASKSITFPLTLNEIDEDTLETWNDHLLEKV